MIAHPFATDEQLWYSPSDAARKLRYHRATIYRLMLSGELPYIQVHGRRKIRWSDLREYDERAQRGELADGPIPLPKPTKPQTKKRAPSLQTKRTQTRNLRSSGRNQQSSMGRS